MTAKAEHRRSDAPIGITLTLASFLPVMVIISLSPAVPTMVQHFSDVPGATTLIPLLVATPGLVVALLAAFAGSVVDRIGRRKPLIIATLSYSLLGLAAFLLDDLWMLFTDRLAVGVCEAFILVATNAMLSDHFDPDRRRLWLTAQAIINSILVAALAMLSGALTGMAWNGAFLSYALVIPIALAIIAFCHDVPSAHPSSVSAKATEDQFPWAKVLAICGITLISSAIFYVFILQAGLAYAAIGVTDPTTTGRYIGLAALFPPLGAILFNFLSRRISPEGVIAVTLALMGTGLITMGLSRSAAVMTAGGIIQQTGAGMLFGSLIYWMSLVLPAAFRGRGFGYWTSANFAGQFASPLLVGVMRPFVDGILPILLLAGALTILFAGCMILIARSKFFR